jgi:CYTH domain-containing protein
MPIENERKFVLKPPFNELENQLASIATNSFLIEQAYLHKGKKFIVRVRSSTCLKDHISWYEMCVKRSVNRECVEIETEIEESDYARLWSVADGKLVKKRYIIEGWEVDFFKDKHHNNYFAQAEIELPPGIAYPERIPSIIEENLLYRVMKGDNRFASKKLCDIYYTNKILHMLLEMKK